MNQLIAIALGGSLGAVARFWVANGIYAWLGRSFPFGTLFVNVSGSFLMGFLTALLMQRLMVAVEYRAASWWVFSVLTPRFQPLRWNHFIYSRMAIRKAH